MDRPLQAQYDTIRVPIYGNDNQRQYPPGITAASQYDSMMLNCFAHKNEETGEWIVQKRQGLHTSSYLNLTGKVTNVSNCTPLALISVAQVNLTFVCAIADLTDGFLYIIAFGGTHGSGVVIGSIATWGNQLNKVFLTEVQLAGVPYLFVTAQNYLGTSSVGYYAATTAGAFTAASLVLVNDVDYPANIAGECTMGAAVQLNDHIFVHGRSGKVYNSDVGSVSSWNSFGVQPASIEPDKGLGLVKYKQHIVAFGDNSIEFFEDAGLKPPGGPLQRAEQAFIKFGTINSASFINIDDKLYWLAAGNSKTSGLWVLDQYTPTKVSVPWIENYIYPLGAYVRLNVFSMAGQKQLAICMLAQGSITPLLPGLSEYVPPSGAPTEEFPVTLYDLTSNMLIYNIDAKTWWGWSDENVGSLAFYSAHNYAALGLVNPSQIFLKQSILNGTAGIEGSVAYQLFDGRIESDSFADDNYDGTSPKAIAVIIQGSPIEFVTAKRKFIQRIQLICDAFRQFSSDTSLGNRLYFMLDKTDGTDAIDTTTKFVTRSVTIPNPNQRYFFNRWGAARKLFWALVCKTKMDFRARALEIDVSQGQG